MNERIKELEKALVESYEQNVHCGWVGAEEETIERIENALPDSYKNKPVEYVK